MEKGVVKRKEAHLGRVLFLTFLNRFDSDGASRSAEARRFDHNRRREGAMAFVLRDITAGGLSVDDRLVVVEDLAPERPSRGA